MFDVFCGCLKNKEKCLKARRSLVLLPCVVEQLQSGDSDASAAALGVLSNMLRLLEGKMLSLTALVLAEKLRPLFDDESDTVRELSIRLFRDAMDIVVGAEKQKMKKEVWDSLLPLLLHMHDQDKSVAKLARKKSKAKDYLHQSQPYLQSPQEPLRQEAVRFIGLVGRHMDGHKNVQYVTQVLQGAREDASPLVSSLATQTVLILEGQRLNL
ncbi:maestro heat-like repeat-containing protein family member 6 isoform 2-T3 [Leptosomus discolor]